MIVIETNIPVEIQPLTVGPHENPPFTAENLKLLRTLNAGSTFRSDIADASASDFNNDLLRLEAKLDLLLSMMGSWVAQTVNLPPSRSVQLSVDFIELEVEANLRDSLSALNLISFYPGGELPQPLRFAADYHVEDGESPTIRLPFRLQPAEYDEFERYLFLEQRRQLAQTR